MNIGENNRYNKNEKETSMDVLGFDGVLQVVYF